MGLFSRKTKPENIENKSIPQKPTKNIDDMSIDEINELGLSMAIQDGDEERIKYFRDSIEDQKRLETPCKFDSGISEEMFQKIVRRGAKRIKAVKGVDFNGPTALLFIQSETDPFSFWVGVISFNDYGRITGKYWDMTYGHDPQLAILAADIASEDLKEYLATR